MTKDIIIALLGIGFLFAVAGLLVALAKLREEKEKRWDEISSEFTLERHYRDLLFDYSMEVTRRKNERLAFLMRCHDLEEKAGGLQDRLSSVLCPTNNHVWKDGVCVKCGRAQDG